MSIDIDPRKPIEIALPYEYNGSPKPVFKFRRLNSAEYIEVCEGFEKAQQAVSNQEATDKAFAALRVGLLDWQNQTDPSNDRQIAFNPDDLPLILNADEALAILAKRLAFARISGRDRKNSE